MTDSDTFREAIRRIRAGDGQAAAELVRKYEPIIRREVRMKLEDARLRRAFDSMDVVQSVLASFFIRTAAGEYDLDSPQKLTRLLVQMARNKLASAARKHYRLRRDTRRIEPNADVLLDATTNDATPGDQLAHEELLIDLRRKLTAEERTIAALRADGHSWGEVAAAMGGKPQARRMQFARGIKRAARELGLAEMYE
jgi:RNA polymerase sigma-70 factor (ECF subfamily)